MAYYSGQLHRRCPLPSFFVWALLCCLVAVSATEERVESLPGFRDSTLPFEMYTGYITVNETSQDYLFYYYVKSEGNPDEDPIILWLTGGPACSGFTAFAYEIGPLRFEWKELDGNLPTLFLDPQRYTTNASIIFLDSPTFTGFSYSETPITEYETGDYKSVAQAYTFLLKWFENHSAFLNNPFYIGGDSYGGIFVPMLTVKVADGIDAGAKGVPNLKGYFVGNPVTDDFYDDSQVIFYRGMSFITEELYMDAEKSCNGSYDVATNAQCEAYLELVDELVSGINEAQVLEVDCGDYWATRPKVREVSRRLINQQQDDLKLGLSPPSISCRGYGYYLGYIWLNNNTVREALHVRKDTVDEWVRCNEDVNFTKEMNSTIRLHYNLTTRGYQSLVYSGDHDSLIPTVGTEGWISSLNFSIVDQWRPWFVNNQVAGFTRKYANNLTFATVKGAGHTTPEYKRLESLTMYGRWMKRQPL